MFASAYFPNAYFPKSYFPASGASSTANATFSNSKVSKRNKRALTVAELIRRDREEAQLALRQTYDGQYLPIVVNPGPSVFVELSEKAQWLIAELDALKPAQEAEAVLKSIREAVLKERARRLLLLGLFGE